MTGLVALRYYLVQTQLGISGITWHLTVYAEIAVSEISNPENPVYAELAVCDRDGANDGVSSFAPLPDSKLSLGSCDIVVYGGK